MQHESLLANARLMCDDVLNELDGKGKDYARNDDALWHFKSVSNELDFTMEEVWAILFMKHVKSIMRYIRDGELTTEPIYDRIKDTIAYLLLLNAMCDERAITYNAVNREIEREY